MKILSALFAFVILVPVLSFALSNQQSVDMGLWPFAGSFSLPLYVLALVPLTGGLMVGGCWGWVCAMPHRIKARRLGKEIAFLRNRLLETEKASALSDLPVFKRKRFWSRWT